MKIVKSNGSVTIYSLRRALGLPSRRPSAFNACVAGALRGPGKFPKPAPGMGGRHNKAVHAAFASAAKSCAGRRG